MGGLFVRRWGELFGGVFVLLLRRLRSGGVRLWNWILRRLRFRRAVPG